MYPALATTALLLASLSSSPRFDELIYADGRREPVVDVRQDSKGNWVGTREGRRVALNAGEIVAIVDAQGKETVILPEPRDAPATAESEALLAKLRDPKHDAWRDLLGPLATPPVRGVHEALVALTHDKSKPLRSRAIWALCALHTKASVMAATEAILGEKDAALRRESASALFSVSEIFRRCDSVGAVERGLADREVLVRLVFAALSPRDHAKGTEILRTEGLKHRDHHVRESAAYDLALRGDAAGESLLISMLQRTSPPAVAENDPELTQRLAIEEKVRVCAVLGKLGTAAGKAALEKALGSPHEAVRAAAKQALEASAAK